MGNGRIKGEEKFHMNVEKFQESMYELIVETSTQLPKDVRRAIKVAKEKESLGNKIGNGTRHNYK